MNQKKIDLTGKQTKSCSWKRSIKQANIWQVRLRGKRGTMQINNMEYMKYYKRKTCSRKYGGNSEKTQMIWLAPQ